MTKFELLSKIMWNNLTRFYFTGMLIAAVAIAFVSTELVISVGSVLSFVLMYGLLRGVTATVITFVEFIIILIWRRFQ